MKGHFTGSRNRRIRFEHLEPRCMMAVIAGDYDRSGLVDQTDYNVWRANFGVIGESSADGNRNSIVDAADFIVWRVNLGKTIADVPPDPPQTVTASVVGPSSVQVSWQAVSAAASYTVYRRQPNVLNDPFVVVASGVTATSYTDNTVSSGTVYEYQIVAVNAAGSSAPSQTTSITAGSANLTAFRQQQFSDPDNPSAPGPFYAPFAKFGVPEQMEESTTVGPGIRINRDDDNHNDIVDRFEGGVAIVEENDLIEVRVDRLAGQGNLVLQAGDDLQLYYTYDKEQPVPLDDDGVFTEALPFSNNMVTVFVEWVDANHGTDMLKLIDPITMLAIDTLVFHTFHSVVIALGGEGQVPGDPVNDPGNQGIFTTAIDLYRNEGYDVRMYDEDDVSPTGQGPAYDQLVNSINNQMQSEVAIFGYSHGGGSVYDLAYRLNDNIIGALFDITEPFAVKFTSYVDAITNNFADAENRRPLLSEYHLNQYQQNTGFPTFLNGGSLDDPQVGDEQIDRSNLGLVHRTIDDNAAVLNLLRIRLLQKVTR